MKSIHAHDIRKYYFYKPLTQGFFFAPILILFLRSKGLSMSDIFILQSIYAFSEISLEVPTGAFADRYGKKISLVIGTFFYALSMFLFAIWGTFIQFVVIQIISAIGMAFMSGADSSFLYETLTLLKKEYEFKKIQGKASSFTQIFGAIASIIGGFVGNVAYSLSFILSGISFVTAGCIALFFSKQDAATLIQEKNIVTIASESLKTIKNNYVILWLIMYFAILNGFISMNSFFLQPYLKLLSVPIFLIGVVYALDATLSGVAAFITTWFEKVTKDKSFLLLSIIASVALGILGVFPTIFVFPVWFLLGMCMMISQIIVSEKILQNVDKNNATTMLSFQNLSRRFTYGLLGPLAGIISDTFGVYVTFEVEAIVMFCLLFFLMIIKNKHVLI